MKKLLFLLIAVFVTGCAKPTEKQGKAQQTIPVGKGPDALFLTPDQNFLYVANVEDSMLSVIDTRTEKVVQTIDAADYPWGFTRLGETNLVAVSGYDKGIDIIDFTTHAIVRGRRFDSNLGGITSSRDGKFLFVIAISKKQAWKLDAKSLEIVDIFSTGNGPDGIGISFDDSKLYVTNTEVGTISIINVNDKSSRLLKPGGKPELIHSSHDRSRLFISNFKNNAVHIIDTRKDEIIHEITGLNGPEEAVLNEQETILYVVNFNSKRVFSYDPVSFKKLDAVYSTGNRPIGIVEANRMRKLFISNYGDNSVSVIKIPN